MHILSSDITTRAVDAVVTAANSSLMGGSGVDGAIHGAAGPELAGACNALRTSTYPSGLPVGQAVATPGFNLRARWIIHTVGPNLLARENDPDLLRACFTNSLRVAEELGAHSIAFPAVGAGIYGWPAETVADEAVEAVNDYRRAVPQSGIELVEFALLGQDVVEIFQDAFGAGADSASE